MISPIGREVDRGGGTAARQNQRAWECNELLHKRVSERHIGATETFELIGMAKHGKRKESNITTRLQLISCFFLTLVPPALDRSLPVPLLYVFTQVGVHY